MTLEDGRVLESADAVLDGAVEFFKNKLTTMDVSVDEPGMDLLFPIILDEDNISLCRTPVTAEVKEALWSNPQDSSPGPDRFSASFF